VQPPFSVDVQEAALDSFDEYVRAQFAPAVLRQVGSGGFCYHHMLLAGASIWWQACDMVPALVTWGSDKLAWYLVEYFCLAFLALPSFFRIVFQLLHLLDAHLGKAMWKQWCVQTLLMVVLWVPLVFCNRRVKDRKAVVTCIVCLLLLNLILFSKTFRNRSAVWAISQSRWSTVRWLMDNLAIRLQRSRCG